MQVISWPKPALLRHQVCITDLRSQCDRVNPLAHILFRLGFMHLVHACFSDFHYRSFYDFVHILHFCVPRVQAFQAEIKHICIANQCTIRDNGKTSTQYSKILVYTVNCRCRKSSWTFHNFKNSKHIWNTEKTFIDGNFLNVSVSNHSSYKQNIHWFIIVNHLHPVIRITNVASSNFQSKRQCVRLEVAFAALVRPFGSDKPSKYRR